ncbi:cache domain-containing sensor histidine kinase [Ructibacterium gallinarum]|uniref:Histidine kinase n=1 Tax=Ructibacterium gallinarum TaxID=2779355 RepID=A0A9D5LZF9_9FIRM|nr:histidine kinase [Ructibacterium gallinarum]MBE5040891.1 histidine kinase [Ructibacterium gallinarum]
MKNFWHILKEKVISFSYSLNFKLLIGYIITIILCLSIFTGIIYYYSDRTLENLSKENVDQMILSTSELLNTFIEDIEYEIFTLQANKSIQKILNNPSSASFYNDIQVLENALLSIDPFKKKFTSAELYVPQPYYPSLSESLNVYSSSEMRNDPWYQSVKNSGDKTCWNIFDYPDKSYIVVAKQLINTITKEPTAIVKLNIDMDYFNNILKDIRLANTGRVFLTTENHIINSYNVPLINQLKNNDILFQTMLKKNHDTQYTEIDNVRYLLVSYALQDTGLYLVGCVNVKEFGDSGIILQRIYLSVLLLMLILIPTILYLISSYITKTITNLADKMKNYKFESNIEVPKGRRDEIHSLYTSYNIMQDIISNLVKDINTAAKIQKKTELKALKIQLTPHFLYNSLNSIAVMAAKYQADDIVNTVSSLSSFFKHSLNNGNEISTIENEIKHVKSYTDIQKIRFGDMFEINFDIEPDLLQQKICNLSLQPLVENCIVHGFGHCCDFHGVINIKAFKEDDDIYIKVEDNGWGINVIGLNELNQYVQKAFDPNEPIEKYGIYNVNQRIKLYFGPQYGLSYSQNDMGGLTATIHITTMPFDS